MSSNLLHNDAMGSLNSGSGSFASLDTAFSQSPHMTEFQEKVNRGNPMGRNQVNGCDLITTQSEEKINNNVDEIVGSFYNRDADIIRQSGDRSARQYLQPHVPEVHDGVTIPLDRSQRYPDNLGSELLEGFDVQQDLRNAAYNLQQGARDVVADANQAAHNMSSMNFWKILLFIILIILLVYAGYCLFVGNETKVSDINIMSAKPGAITLSETFRKFFG